ncbi:MAG: hypothetical protein ACXVP8_02520 [Actinomycetota bacterium]
MRRIIVRYVVATAVTAVSLATCVFFLSAAPASAGLTDLLPSLDPTPIVSPVTNLLSSPTPLTSTVDNLLSPSPTPTVTGVPSVPVTGTLNDTINQLTGTLGLTSPTSSPDPTSGGSGGNGSTGTTTTGSGANTATSTGNGSLATGHSSGLTMIDGLGVLTSGITIRSPYGAIAGDAIRRAAGRALHLAGPLAPPLLLGCIALAVLLALSRGSTSLVKIDTAGIAGRRWRI